MLEAGPAARAEELCHGRSEEPDHCHESPLGPHPPGNNSRGQAGSLSLLRHRFSVTPKRKTEPQPRSNAWGSDSRRNVRRCLYRHTTESLTRRGYSPTGTATDSGTVETSMSRVPHMKQDPAEGCAAPLLGRLLGTINQHPVLYYLSKCF